MKWTLKVVAKKSRELFNSPTTFTSPLIYLYKKLIIEVIYTSGVVVGKAIHMRFVN